jgi:hypothetical protein
MQIRRLQKDIGNQNQTDIEKVSNACILITWKSPYMRTEELIENAHFHLSRFHDTTCLDKGNFSRNWSQKPRSMLFPHSCDGPIPITSRDDFFYGSCHFRVVGILFFHKVVSGVHPMN